MKKVKVTAPVSCACANLAWRPEHYHLPHHPDCVVNQPQPVAQTLITTITVRDPVTKQMLYEQHLQGDVVCNKGDGKLVKTLTDDNKRYILIEVK